MFGSNSNNNNNTKPKLVRTQRQKQIALNLQYLPADILSLIGLFTDLETIVNISRTSQRLKRAMSSLTSQPTFWCNQAQHFHFQVSNPKEMNQELFIEHYVQLKKKERHIAIAKQNLGRGKDSIFTLEKITSDSAVEIIITLAKHNEQDLLNKIYQKIALEYEKSSTGNFWAFVAAMIICNQPEIFELQNISPNDSYNSLTYLCWAIRCRHNDLAVLLINTSQASINYDLKNNVPNPLLVACQSGNKEMVEILISGNKINGKKANINDVYLKFISATMPFEEHHALQSAVENGHTDIVKYLLQSYKDKIAQINNNPKSSTSMDKIILLSLQTAVKMNHIEMVKLLIPHCELSLTGNQLKELLSAAKKPIIKYFILILQLKNQIGDLKSSKATQVAAQLLLTSLMQHKPIKDLPSTCKDINKGTVGDIFASLNKLNLEEIWQELAKHPSSLDFLQEDSATEIHANRPSQR